MGERQRAISGWTYLASGNFGSCMVYTGRLQGSIGRV